MFDKLKHFILESRRELSRVNWPSKEETMRLTGVVIAISLGIALFLGAFDALFFVGVRTLVDVAPAPIEDILPNNASSTSSSTSAELPNLLSPVDVKADGKVEITTE